MATFGFPRNMVRANFMYHAKNGDNQSLWQKKFVQLLCIIRLEKGTSKHCGKKKHIEVYTVGGAVYAAQVDDMCGRP